MQADFLRDALDRLANFFVSPSFARGASNDQVDRERHAVDSEHSHNLMSNEWRLDQLRRSLSINGSAYHKFGTGSLETLTGDGLEGNLSKW